MITDQEEALIKKFVIKEKQDRYLTFLANDKNRKKFTKELFHFNDFNWNLFHEISGNEIVSEMITNKIKSKKNISTCYIISADTNYDKKEMSVEEAITNALGIEGTILIFGNAEIIYYEGEPPNQRYISI